LPKAKGRIRQTGTRHTDAMKNLPVIAADTRISGWEPVLERGHALTTLVKDFRDDHVVHRSSKNPRGIRSVTVLPGGSARIQAGGIHYPRAGETVSIVTSEDPATLLAELEAYVEAALDLVEPFAPPKDASLPPGEVIEELLAREQGDVFGSDI